MSELIAVLGKHLVSAEAASLRNAYPRLAPEVLDLAPDEGMPKDHYLSSPADGISLKHTASGQVTTVFLMGEGKDGYAQFADALPEGLSFTHSPTEVRRALGTPSFERAAARRPFAHGELLRFDRPGYVLHIQFRESGTGIDLLTLMPRSHAEHGEA